MTGAGERTIRAFGGYQPGLDGIRALSVIGVMGYHAQLAGFDGAFLGVSQFFTLSGFLITAILLDERRRTDSVDLRSFWIRRFRRLAPAALLGLVVVAIFGATVATRAQAERLPEEMLGVVTYVVNWVFIGTEQSYTDLFAAPSPLQHYWSLAVEEQFYLLIPLLLFGLFRMGASNRTIGLVLGAVTVGSGLWMVVLFESGADLDRIYYGTDARLGEVMLGAVVAVVLDTVGVGALARIRGVLAVAGVVAIGALAWLWTATSLTSAFVWRGGFQLNALLTVVVILAVLGGRGPLPKVLALAPLVGLGKLSYGIYVFHFPIFLWLTEDRTGLEGWPLFAFRAAVSLVLAYISYRFVEQPIRHGTTVGLPAAARIAAYPVVGAAIIAGTLLTANTDGDDPLATLRVDDDSIRVQAPDGVLDIVVVHDRTSNEGVAVVDELFALVADEEQVSITDVDLACTGGVADTDSGPTCAAWSTDWSSAVTDDPDAVVFFADDWVGDALADLGPSIGSADDTAAATTLLSNGFDLLTDSGAPLVFVSSGATFQEIFARSLNPLQQAMAELAPARDDVFAVLAGAMPDPGVVDGDDFIGASAQTLLDSAVLYQRADREGDARVLVVGDSQARSLGFGLERWGADNSTWVWNVAVNGCGLADEGQVFGSGEAKPVREECREVIDGLRRQVASFDPDVVIVFSSTWDLVRRQLDDWDEPIGIDDPDFRSYLEREYALAAEVLGANGASILWIEPPCVEVRDNGFGSPDGVDAEEERTTLIDEVIPAVVAAATAADVDIATFDLDAVLCPDGEPLQEADGVRPIRGDGVHFNVDGSAWFAQNYGEELLALGGVAR